jgi:uncharacterized HhH-GPD family protein
MALWLTGDSAADALLEHDGFALLVAMLLDQQVPMERAFSAPSTLKARLGGRLDPAAIAAADPEELAAAFSAKPALHRFPRSMAQRVQALARAVCDRHGGDAASIWTTAADGRELVARLRGLPGFGQQKAQILLALLGKRLQVQPPGWERAAGPYGAPGSFVSVADVDSPEALERVREHKRSLKAASRSLASLGGAGGRPPGLRVPARRGRGAP